MLAEGSKLTVGTHKVRITRYLSEGGFSKIYEVTMDPAEGETEVGCLKQVLIPDKAGLNLLRKEVDVMKALRNARSIVKYYDSNAERLPDGTYQVLVLMELCPNNSLLHFMNDRIREKLSEKEILKIMLDISIGVYEMHAMKLIHRDIKIENVLIDAKNNFKLCDFGSVSRTVRPPQNQQEFQALSHDILYNTTPQYRAPEMIDLYRGYPIDEKSDIWALGCFLYKLCYYITPFETNGDIAILHASFHFPPLPAYSGDLKNLIIIMLQESPLLRPNIFQIIQLLVKMIHTDFSKLDIEDFYGAGPYDFQALHEMQREKQQQLLKQQQYYLEQQKQQEAYERSKANTELSKVSSRISVPAIISDNDTKSRSQSSRSKSPTTDEYQSSVEPRYSSESPRQAGLQSSHSVSSNMSKTLSSDTSDSDSEVSDPEQTDLRVELPELDNVAERFPSLENLNNTAPSVDEAKSKELSGSVLEPHGVDSDGDATTQEQVQNVDLKKTESGKNRNLVPNNSSIDAWKNATNSTIHKDAENLVNEIFMTGTGDARKKDYSISGENSAPKNYVEMNHKIYVPKVSTDQQFAFDPRTHSMDVSRGLKTDHKPETLPARLALQKSSQKSPELGRSDDSMRIAISQSMDSSLIPREATHNKKQDREDTPVYYQQQKFEAHGSKRDFSNPWGNAITRGVQTDELPANSSEDQYDLSHQLNDLSLNPQATKPHKSSAEGDLIDLDGVQSSPNSAPVQRRSMESMGPPREIMLEEMHLIDLDNGLSQKDQKPQVRKRLSGMQPQPIAFQEQVIDFASDDENVKSEMSRVSIRNSLKNRKHSDHKRSESSHVEGKKRKSFFGGTSDQKDFH